MGEGLTHVPKLVPEAILNVLMLNNKTIKIMTYPDP